MVTPPALARALAPLLCALALLASPADAQTTKRVLVLYSTGRLLPALVEFDRGFRSRGLETPSSPVEVYDEFLDAARFSGPEHERLLATYLVEKYRAIPPHVIVAAGAEALRFALHHRSRLVPSTAIVHAAVTRQELAVLPPLPADVVGVPSSDEFVATVEQALRWRPKASRLLLVSGTVADRDRRWTAQLRTEAAQFAPRLRVEHLAGLAPAEIMRQLRTTGDDTIVFTPGYYIDGGRRFAPPRDAVTAIAAAAPAPVFVPLSTMVGTGAVGGFVTDFETQGRIAAGAVAQLLAGRAPSALHLPESMPTTFRADWRQMQRFGLSEALLPVGSVVDFRVPSLWQQYRRTVTATLAVMVLQAALIGGLLIERRRRHRAEATVARSRMELAHASRLAVAGELAAALAHEINQPLGAILSNADTAEMLLDGGGDERDLLRQILADIRRDDVRASEVIRRLRTLLQKNEVDRQPFVLEEAVSEVELVLRAEARRRQVVLSLQPSGHSTQVLGDRVQIQQVLINLVLNAMDAVAGLPDERRLVTIAVRTSASASEIEVRDRGPGIALDHLPRIFESFFTTKRSGMGLGLSIARTIVDAHGGRIEAGNGTSEGAVFRVMLPVEGRPPQEPPPS